MSQLLSTFFAPRGVTLTLICVMYICILGSKGLYFLERYEYWQDKYEQKRLYLQQEVCANSDIKARLEGENYCDANKIFLRTPIWRRSALDMLETVAICSEGWCQQWLNQLLAVFVLGSILLAYFLIRHTAETIDTFHRVKNPLLIIFESPRNPKKFE